MKRFIFLVLIILSAATYAGAQTSTTTQNARRLPNGSGAPSGSCVAGPPFIQTYIDSSTTPPTTYYCKAGTWTASSGGATAITGSGTANTLTKFNATNTVTNSGATDDGTTDTFKLTETAPGAATTALAGAGAGNVANGAHIVKVTCVTTGGQTTAGTASNTTTVVDKTTDGKIAITGIPLCSAIATGRDVYMTTAGGSTYKLLSNGTIANNTATTLTANDSDATLTASTTAPSTNTAIDARLTVGQSTITPAVPVVLPNGSTATTQSQADNSTKPATTAYADTLGATKLNLAGGTLTGALLFTDNLYDIGASGATRPRRGYFGTEVVAPLFTGAFAGNATTATDTASKTGTGSTYATNTAPTITNPVVANIAPGADFTITQNSVVPFKSENTSAVVDTLHLKAGKVGIGSSNPAYGLTLTKNGSALTGNALINAQFMDGTAAHGVSLGYDLTRHTAVLLADTGAAASGFDFYTFTGSAFVNQMAVGSGGTLTLTSGITNAAGTPGSLCYNTSTFEVTKNNALTCTVSSRRFKQGILNLPKRAISAFDRLRPVQFAYRDHPERLRYGFIAEEAGTADRRFADGYDAKGENPTSIDQNAILAATVREVQELKQRFVLLEKENLRLRRQLRHRR